MTTRRKRLLILAAAIVVGAAIVVPNIYCRNSAGWCLKCAIRYRDSSVSVFDITIWSTEHTGPPAGTPTLRATQQTCRHRFCSSGSGGYLFGGKERWCSLGPYGPMWARQCERPGGLAEVVRSLEYYGEDRRAKCAWFMQQATGRDFGIVFNEKKGEPVVPPDAVARILAWWEAEGKALYPGRTRTPATAAANQAGPAARR